MTPFWRRQPVCLVNARVVLPCGLTAASVRFTGRVLATDEPPRNGDVVVDVGGAIVLPGLVNAHDHLELNHYGKLKGRDRYENASDWIDDMRPRLRADPSIRAGQAYALADRLFIGGLKNVLAGVTTVAHHNPAYRELACQMPVRVVRRYGWAHSFLLERKPVGARGEAGGEVKTRYRDTPKDVPFIVHIAEGVDEAARAEVDRLDAIGCLHRNTVIVHGVGITPAQWARVRRSGAGLVWCPSSNEFLFGRSAPVAEWIRQANGADAPICLGSDSRITGARDLLDELHVAASTTPLGARELLAMVTSRPADLLRAGEAGRIRVGAPADLLVVAAANLTPADALLQARRRNVSLVTVGGHPMIGAPTMAAVFTARGARPRPIVVDEVPKIASAPLARRVASCPIREPGVECA